MVTGHGNHGDDFQLISGQTSSAHCGHLTFRYFIIPDKTCQLTNKKRPCGRTSYKIEVTLDCFFLRNQSRVTSLISWYLTSLVNLSFLRSDVPSPDKNWITSGNLFVLYRIIYKRKKYVRKKLLSTLSYGLESCFRRSLVSPLCMFIIPLFFKNARRYIV